MSLKHILLVLISYLTLFQYEVFGQNSTTMNDNNNLREKLTKMQYFVTQEKGTERPFTGEYWNFFEKGTYYCVCCNAKLFESDSKFASSCGWPSFFDSKYSENILFQKDTTYNMIRTEVLCKVCKAHLGHIFDDGPKPTGKRFCINSASLKFTPNEKSKNGTKSN